MISFKKKKASQLNPKPKQGCKLEVLLMIPSDDQKAPVILLNETMIKK